MNKVFERIRKNLSQGRCSTWAGASALADVSASVGVSAFVVLLVRRVACAQIPNQI